MIKLYSYQVIVVVIYAGMVVALLDSWTCKFCNQTRFWAHQICPRGDIGLMDLINGSFSWILDLNIPPHFALHYTDLNYGMIYFLFLLSKKNQAVKFVLLWVTFIGFICNIFVVAAVTLPQKMRSPCNWSESSICLVPFLLC